MFIKKKADIPPRPRTPHVEQILEDISNSSRNDVLFADPNTGNFTSLEDFHQSDPETLYLRIKHFVDLSATLKNLLQTLQAQSDALKASDLELKAMADDIRKQALEALT